MRAGFSGDFDFFEDSENAVVTSAECFELLAKLATVSSDFQRIAKPFFKKVLESGDILGQPLWKQLPFAIALCSQRARLNKLQVHIQSDEWNVLLALFQQCRMQNLETIVLHLDSMESMHQMTAWPLLGRGHVFIDLSMSNAPTHEFRGLFHEARCRPEELVEQRLRQAGIAPWGAQPPAAGLLPRLTAFLRSAGQRLASVCALDLGLNDGRGASQRIDCATLAAVAAACRASSPSLPPSPSTPRRFPSSFGCAQCPTCGIGC